MTAGGDLLQARQPRQITPESPVAQGRHGDHGDDRALPDWRNVKLRSAVIISALCAAAGLAAGSAPAFAATPRPAGSPVSASTVSTVRQPGFVSVSAPGHTEGWASVTYLRAHPDAIPGLRVTVAPSTVIPDSASGCNYDVCIDITGSSTNVSNWTTTAYGNVGCTMPWFIWTEPGQGTEHEAGPNICPTSGGDGVYYDTQGPFGYFPGGSHLCNTWNRIPGEPCENIKA